MGNIGCFDYNIVYVFFYIFFCFDFVIFGYFFSFVFYDFFVISNIFGYIVVIIVRMGCFYYVLLYICILCLEIRGKFIFWVNFL